MSRAYFTAYSCIFQNISRGSKLNGITGFTENFNLLLRGVKTFFIIDKVNVYKNSRMFFYLRFGAVYIEDRITDIFSTVGLFERYVGKI